MTHTTVTTINLQIEPENQRKMEYAHKWFMPYAILWTVTTTVSGALTIVTIDWVAMGPEIKNPDKLHVTAPRPMEELPAWLAVPVDALDALKRLNEIHARQPINTGA